VSLDTEAGRRASRFVYAKRRVEYIANALPKLTPEQRAELASILLAPAESVIPNGDGSRDGSP